MANSTNIDPRFLSYDKDEVERILDSVERIDEAPTAESKYPISSGGVKAALEIYPTKEEIDVRLNVATEENVRGIVTAYTPTTTEEPVEGE